MAMHSPPHPGSILKEDVLPDLNLTVTDAAAGLGVSRVTLSRMINGRAGISPDMALRLEAWLGNPSAEAWLQMQLTYDLWHARQTPPSVRRTAEQAGK
jgi:addiction module HigA family antidote